MVIIIAISIYFLLIWLGIFCIFKIKNLIQVIRKQKEAIDNLDKELYKDLRMVQYNAMDISKQANKYIKGKNSILGEIISTLALSLLPFKKLKSILYLHKLGQKCFARK